MIRLIIILIAISFNYGIGQDVLAFDDLDRKSKKKFEQAYEYLKTKDYKKAESLLINLTSKYPRLLSAQKELAKRYIKSRRKNKALERLLIVDQLSTQFGIPFKMSLADLLEEKNQYSKAANHLKQLSMLNNISDKEMLVISHRYEELKFRRDNYNNPKDIHLELLGSEINSPNDEYLPAMNADQSVMIFTRRKTISSSHIKTDEDLFISEMKDSKFSESMPLKALNTYQNEGAHSFSPDGKVIVFTSCNRRDSYGGCDLYISFNKNGSWTKAQNMGPDINSRYWDSQPVIVNNNRSIIFCSKRPGGYGGSDLWKVDLLENNNWAKPQNLGSVINTKNDEASPFLHPDNLTLYFRSNGHIGMGDYDLFMAKKNEEGKWDLPKNLGYPINTKGSEGALFVDLPGHYAYYASDAENNHSNLDIIRFPLPEEIKPEAVSYIKIIVVDASNAKPIKARINIIDLNQSQADLQLFSDHEGKILSTIIHGDYSINIEKEGYIFHSENIKIESNRNQRSPFIYTIALQKLPVISTAEFKSKPVILNNIFFESSSSILLSKSEVEINNLYLFLSDNNNLEVEIIGHTDNIGTSDDNITLSTLRAEAVYKALIEKGIKESRLSFKGMGESSPIETNDSSEGRQKNRRTEFVVINL